MTTDLKPTILAGETIGANLCVVISPTGFGFKSSTGTTVVGVTASSVDNNREIQFQSGPYYSLTAGGSITIGDNLASSSNGTVATTTSRGQFVSLATTVAGKTFLAKKC
jgi:hypothetical protein